MSVTTNTRTVKKSPSPDEELSIAQAGTPDKNGDWSDSTSSLLSAMIRP
jgi:hypothetical protein